MIVAISPGLVVAEGVASKIMLGNSNATFLPARRVVAEKSPIRSAVHAGGSHVPQGLKPAPLLALGGTAEAVPFPNRFISQVHLAAS